MCTSSADWSTQIPYWASIIHVWVKFIPDWIYLPWLSFAHLNWLNSFLIVLHSSFSWAHRESTAREERGWGLHFFRQIEPNWPLPYSTVPVPWLRDSRRAGWVTYCSTYMREYNPRAGQGRKGFNSFVKTIYFSYLPIIYLWLSCTQCSVELHSSLWLRLTHPLDEQHQFPQFSCTHPFFNICLSFNVDYLIFVVLYTYTYVIFKNLIGNTTNNNNASLIRYLSIIYGYTPTSISPIIFI